jgi:methyl-accepting chemotaxis protein
MLNKLTIIQRIAAGFILVIACLAGTLIPIAISNLNKISEDAQQNKLKILHASFINIIGKKSRQAVMLSTYIANTPEVQAAIAVGDRTHLSKLTLPAFTQLKKDYGVRQFQFHTPDAHSFFRVHKPTKFGDDLSGFRKTVVETNRLKKPMYGIEAGVAGLGIRGVVPIFSEGRHLGSVEMGLSLGQFFLDKFKKDYGTEIGNFDISMLIPTSSGFTLTASTLEEKSNVLTPGIMTSAFKGEPITQKTDIDGKPGYLYVHALNDYSGKPVALLSFEVDNSHFSAVLNTSIRELLILSLVIIALSALIAFFISRSIIQPLGAEPFIMEQIAKRVASGDLEVEFNDTQNTNSVYAALELMVNKLKGLIGQVGASADSINSGAKEISRGTLGLAQRTEEQASGLVEMVSSMRQMEETVAENSQSTLRASELSNSVAASASQGEEVVDKANKAMYAINESSHKITEIISVIDEIAFQTNLLALNAAVEAAHAGDQGRGFAIVAAEVRNLAQRSATAAQEIKELIQDSVSKVENGAQLVTETGSTLHQIAASIKDLHQELTQLAGASEEQAAGISDINATMASIEEVTLANTSLVEETSVASRGLSDEAGSMIQELSVFKISGRTVKNPSAVTPLEKSNSAPKETPSEPEMSIASGF